MIFQEKQNKTFFKKTDTITSRVNSQVSNLIKTFLKFKLSATLHGSLLQDARILNDQGLLTVNP